LKNNETQACPSSVVTKQETNQQGRVYLKHVLDCVQPSVTCLLSELYTTLPQQAIEAIPANRQISAAFKRGKMRWRSQVHVLGLSLVRWASHCALF